MALTKDQKATQLNDLKDKLQKSESVMFAHYIGMNVADVSDFRAKLKEANAEMKVAKKTLMQLAVKDLNMPELTEEAMEGPVACIFSYEDPLSGAQIAFKFGKDHPQVELIGGFFEGKLMSKEETMRLAQIPGKQQLLGMFMAMCNGPLSSFARGLSELAKQKEEASAAPAAEVAAPVPAEEKKEEPAIEAPAPTDTAADQPAEQPTEEKKDDAPPPADQPASDTPPTS